MLRFRGCPCPWGAVCCERGCSGGSTGRRFLLYGRNSDVGVWHLGLDRVAFGVRGSEVEWP
jgi:hypothetical protein